MSQKLSTICYVYSPAYITWRIPFCPMSDWQKNAQQLFCMLSLTKQQDGVSVGGLIINAVRYGDDKAVVSNNRQDCRV